MKHYLEANHKTVHWGFLSAEINPVLNINSGDEVEITSVSGPPEVTKNSPYEVKESLLEIHEKSVRGTLKVATYAQVQSRFMGPKQAML